jgi:DHA1 family tetracycline resistance protein-like MFS transporter
MFLATFAFAGMETTFALLGAREFGLGERGFGLIFTYVGVLAIVVQGVLVRRLHRRFGERTLAVAGTVLMGVGLIAIPAARSTFVAMVFLTALAVGQGLVSPSLVSLLSQESSSAEQGSTLGVGQSFSAAARAAGPLVAGGLYDRSIALPYLAGGALILAGGWLISRRGVGREAPVPQDGVAG